MTLPDDTEPSAEALVVARDLCNRLGLADQFNGPYPGDVRVISLALDRFRAAGVREAEVENEWLRRLLRWCRPRLKHGSYQVWLDKYIELGPSPAPEDEPPLMHSEPPHAR